MAEPQEIVDEESAAHPEKPVDEQPRTSASTIEIDGRVWTVVELPDRESWDLYAGPGEDRTRLLGHISITDEGYFSMDARGAVRGPYVTLSEATYPLGLDDPLLLGDDVEPTAPHDEPTSPSGSSSPLAARRPWGREVWLIAFAVVAALLAQRLIQGRHRAVRSSGRGSDPRRS
jgi:hypothetical protein